MERRDGLSLQPGRVGHSLDNIRKLVLHNRFKVPRPGFVLWHVHSSQSASENCQSCLNGFKKIAVLWMDEPELVAGGIASSRHRHAASHEAVPKSRRSASTMREVTGERLR